MKAPRIFTIALIALVLALLASPAYAHGFGQRYDLPVPLNMFLIGAVATVALSFWSLDCSWVGEASSSDIRGSIC